MSVKAMKLRDELFNPTTVTNAKQSNSLYGEEKIKQRWEEYFKDLLHSAGMNNLQPQLVTKNLENVESNIVKGEVRKALVMSAKQGCRSG